MLNDEVFLFVDTNLFIQCQELEQLDWSDWKEFSVVSLIVSRPVQREIDRQKDYGTDRVQRRARMAHNRFQGIIKNPKGFQLIREANPAVKLFLEALKGPSERLKDHLDYSKPDDEIVGCLHRFTEENPAADARLLTHDTGPMVTAKFLNLSFVDIKENWFLPPGNSETEKENIRLRARVAELERKEPQFKIWLVDDKGENTERLDIEWLIYPPLPEEDLRALIGQLSSRFPMETDFGPDHPMEEEYTRGIGGFLGTKRVYTPASSEEINKYKTQDYPKWIRNCEETLRNLHDDLESAQAQPGFTFAVSNEGTCPGEDTLTMISAEGNFEIRPPLYQANEAEVEQTTEVRLSRPPRPPKGNWKVTSPERDLLASDWFARVGGVSGLLNQQYPTVNFPDLSLLTPPADRRRDPNALYYKPNRPAKPGKSFALECDQWRHKTGPKPFVGNIFFPEDIDLIEGALRCEVHAGNLSEPTQKKIPIKITVKEGNTIAKAQSLVNDLIDPAL